MSQIASVIAREIFDGRGNPTLEVDLTLSDGAFGRAALPSGGSKGRNEVAALRDPPTGRYGGLGVRQAVAKVNEVIGPTIRGVDASDQIALDTALLTLDGTDTKRNLGGNAILGVSMAGARAAAASARAPVYRHLGGPDAVLLPLPLFDVINGGSHADNNLDVEEFLIAPIAAKSFSEALRWGAECFAALRTILNEKRYRTSVGDQGGFAPELTSNEEALELVVAAIERAGFDPGADVVLALDASASASYDGATYTFPRSDRRRRSSAEMVELWSRWVRDYPIWFIEDGMAEDDFEGWRLLTNALGKKVTLVGDDVFATDPDTISSAVTDEIGNAIVVKLDQIGTVTEAAEAIEEARAGRYATIVSGRSGDTVDDFIADFAVATGVGAIKGGAPSRGERVAKYNQLLRIEEQLGTAARYAGPRGIRG